LLGLGHLPLDNSPIWMYNVYIQYSITASNIGVKSGHSITENYNQYQKTS
jgi:hypothetical protein